MQTHKRIGLARWILLALLLGLCGCAAPRTASAPAFLSRAPLPTFTPRSSATPEPAALSPSNPSHTPSPTLATFVATSTFTWRAVVPLELRREPQTTAPVVDRLAIGTTVLIGGRTADRKWLYVSVPAQGWVSAGAIEAVWDPLAALPLLGPTPAPTGLIITVTATLTRKP